MPFIFWLSVCTYVYISDYLHVLFSIMCVLIYLWLSICINAIIFKWSMYIFNHLCIIVIISSYLTWMHKRKTISFICVPMFRLSTSICICACLIIDLYLSHYSLMYVLFTYFVRSVTLLSHSCALISFHLKMWGHIFTQGGTLYQFILIITYY